MPYEVELNSEVNLVDLESYPDVTVLGLITSTPMVGGAGPFNGWRDGIAVTDIYGDASLDDRFAIDCAESVAVDVSAQGWCEWVAPLDPTATYTSGIPVYNGQVLAVVGGTTDKPGPYTVRHGDTFNVTAFPDVAEPPYVFANWEINRAGIGIVTSVDNPLAWVFDQNYPIWIQPVFTGGPVTPPDVTVNVFKLPELTPVQTFGMTYCVDTPNIELDAGRYRIIGTNTEGIVRQVDKDVVGGQVTTFDLNFAPTLPIVAPILSAVAGGVVGYLGTGGNIVGGVLGAVAGGSLAIITIPRLGTTTCLKCGKSFTFTTRNVPVWCPHCGLEQTVKYG